MKLPVEYKSLTWVSKDKVKDEYTKLQDGNCYYCKGPLKHPPIQNKKINWKLFPPNFLKYPIHLHHDHSTDMTIGVVHAYCNAVLWQYHGE